VNATARQVDGELARLNQAIYDEYTRITGLTSRVQFAEFVQLTEAHIAARLNVPAPFLHANSSPIAQAYRLLEHLRAQPAVVWPSLDLQRQA
jgi:hypothetical protein